MKFFLFVIVVASTLACQKRNHAKPVPGFVPQDLSYITNHFRNGCFRLQNSKNQFAYLYIDVENVKSIVFSSDEAKGTAHVYEVQALTSDGRVFNIEPLIYNYQREHFRSFTLAHSESIKSIRVYGHSNYPYEGGGRQRVNVEVYSDNSEELAVPLEYCDPNQQPPTLIEQLESAFSNAYGVKIKSLN